MDRCAFEFIARRWWRRAEVASKASKAVTTGTQAADKAGEALSRVIP